MYIYGIDKNKQERGEFLMKLKGLLALLLPLSMTLLTACGAQTQPTEEKTATSDVQTVREMCIRDSLTGAGGADEPDRFSDSAGPQLLLRLWSAGLRLQCGCSV